MGFMGLGRRDLEVQDLRDSGCCPCFFENMVLGSVLRVMDFLP